MCVYVYRQDKRGKGWLFMIGNAWISNCSCWTIVCVIYVSLCGHRKNRGFFPCMVLSGPLGPGLLEISHQASAPLILFLPTHVKPTGSPVQITPRRKKPFYVSSLSMTIPHIDAVLWAKEIHPAQPMVWVTRGHSQLNWQAETEKGS